MKERASGSRRLPTSSWVFDSVLALVAAGLSTAFFVSEPMARGQLFENDPSFSGTGIGFPLPWLTIAVLVAAAAIASLLATLWPARQASHIRPAVALRIAD
jgi:ABC-type lipoprotein release transport system permease subunit